MNKGVGLIVSVLLVVSLFTMVSCEPRQRSSTKSDSGVEKASVKLVVGSSGTTVEQENVANRLKNDNMPGAIKHLYVISSYSGEVIMYSTVRGKVTSGKKRLTPRTVAAIDGANVYKAHNGMPVSINGLDKYTSEVLEDDGTYGESMDYIFWWDTKRIYHQHMVTGGQIIHIADAPLAVKNVMIYIGTGEQ